MSFAQDPTKSGHPGMESGLPQKPKEAIGCFECPARYKDLCGGLSDANLPALDRASTHIELTKAQTLFLDDEPARHIYSVRQGTVTVYRMGPSGQRQILGFLFPGDLLGLSPGETYGVTAEACTPAKVCRWEREKFEDLLILFPAMDRRFRLITSKILGRSLDLAYALGQLSAEQRIAAFLLYLAERQEEDGGPHGRVKLPMSRADIADYLGLTIETVSRGLTKLKTRGLIALPTSDQVEFKKIEELHALGEGA